MALECWTKDARWFVLDFFDADGALEAPERFYEVFYRYCRGTVPMGE
jgi:hypothetical protein